MKPLLSHEQERVAIVIPARMESSRLPNKPLRHYRGKPLLHWAWAAASEAKNASARFVVTDSEAVEDWCQFADVPCYVSTHSAVTCGTERLARLVNRNAFDYQTIVNLQCDEPDVSAADLDRLIDSTVRNRWPMATFCYRPQIVPADPNAVKVVRNQEGVAAYFSRQPLPGADVHVGVYAMKRGILDSYLSLPRSRLERAEDLEQLRTLERGVPIHVLDLGRPVCSINCEEDLHHA